jgi:hypothetical protein
MRHLRTSPLSGQATVESASMAIAPCLPLRGSVRRIGNPGGGAFGSLSNRPRSVAAGHWNPGRPESSGPPAEVPGPAPGRSDSLRRVQAARLQHPCELDNRAATHGVHLEARHHLPLQPPGLAKLVQRDCVDRQLMRDCGHALPVRRPLPVT